MADEIQMKVSPNVLRKKAESIEEQIELISGNWANLKQTVFGLRAYWTGEASSFHQKEFASYTEEIDELLKRLKKYPIDLMTMAGVYEKTENTVEEITSLLSGNVIS